MLDGSFSRLTVNESLHFSLPVRTVSISDVSARGDTQGLIFNISRCIRSITGLVKCMELDEALG